MLKTLYLFRAYAPMDAQALACKLRKMARRGWHLTKYRYGRLKFKRGQPTDVAFAVTYLPIANEFDPKRPESQEVYITMCEESGWELVTVYGSLHIFRSLDPNAIPVETDDRLRLQMIERVTPKPYLRTMIFYMIWPMIFLIPFRYAYFSGFLFESYETFLVLSLPLNLFLYGATELLWYYLWRMLSRKHTAEGLPLFSPLTRLRVFLRKLYALPLALLYLRVICLLPKWSHKLLLLSILLAAPLFCQAIDDLTLAYAKRKMSAISMLNRIIVNTQFTSSKSLVLSAWFGCSGPISRLFKEGAI